MNNVARVQIWTAMVITSLSEYTWTGAASELQMFATVLCGLSFYTTLVS